MVAAFVGAWAGAQLNNVTSGTTAARTTTVGNTIVAAITSDQTNVTATDSKGNTITAWSRGWVKGTTGDFHNVFVIPIVTGGAGHTIGFTTGGSGRFVTICAAEYSGVAASAFLDQDAQGGGNSTALTATTPATTQADELIVGFGTMNTGTNSAWTAGSGYAIRSSVTDGTAGGVGFLEDKIVSATGAQTAAATYGGSAGDWSMGVVTLKAAVGGPQQAVGAATATFTPAGVGSMLAFAAAAVVALFSPVAVATSTQQATATAAVTFTPSATWTPGGLQQATGTAGAIFAAAATPQYLAAGSAPTVFTPAAVGTIIKAPTTAPAATVFTPAASATSTQQAAAPATVAFAPSATPLGGNQASGTAAMVFTPSADSTSKQQAQAATTVNFRPSAYFTSSTDTGIPGVGQAKSLTFEYAIRGKDMSADDALVLSQHYEQRDRDLEDYLNGFAAYASYVPGVSAPGGLVPPAGVPGVAEHPTVWFAMVGGAGWFNYGGGYQIARYTRKHGVVYIEGLVGSNAGATATVTTLPIGYRPAANLIFVEVAATGAIRMDIDSAGNIGQVPVPIAFASIVSSFVADPAYGIEYGFDQGVPAVNTSTNQVTVPIAAGAVWHNGVRYVITPTYAPSTGVAVGQWGGLTFTPPTGGFVSFSGAYASLAAVQAAMYSRRSTDFPICAFQRTGTTTVTVVDLREWF